MSTEEERQAAEPASPILRTDHDRRAPVSLLVAIALAASLLGIVLGILIDWFPFQASEQAEQIDTVYDVLLAASVPMFVLVMTVVGYCVWKFRMKPGEELLDGPPIHGNTRLEVIWTTIPALLMLALSTYAYIVLRDIEAAPAAGQPELNVRVVGEQFTWTFYYPAESEGGEEIASAQLYVPQGQSVKFDVQSKDVIHDFWVPAFRMKIDAVPGITTFYRVTPTRLGSYPVVCAELCGIGHSVMRQTATVLSPEDFDQWLADERAGGGEEETGGGGEGEQAGGGAVDGAELFTGVQPSCGACHQLADAGTPAGVGPNLDESLAGKDEEYVRRAITDPEADIAEGFSGGIMPSNYGETLDPAEIDALVEYLMETTQG